MSKSKKETLKKTLSHLGLERRNVCGDGNCFYYAILDQLDQKFNLGLLKALKLDFQNPGIAEVDFVQLVKQFVFEHHVNQEPNRTFYENEIEAFRDIIIENEYIQTLDEYIEYINQRYTYTDEMMIHMVLRAFNVNLVIIDKGGKKNIYKSENACADLFLYFDRSGEHYESFSNKNNSTRNKRNRNHLFSKKKVDDDEERVEISLRKNSPKTHNGVEKNFRLITAKFFQNELDRNEEEQVYENQENNYKKNRNAKLKKKNLKFFENSLDILVNKLSEGKRNRVDHFSKKLSRFLIDKINKKMQKLTDIENGEDFERQRRYGIPQAIFRLFPSMAAEFSVPPKISATIDPTAPIQHGLEIGEETERLEEKHNINNLLKNITGNFAISEDVKNELGEIAEMIAHCLHKIIWKMPKGDRSIFSRYCVNRILHQLSIKQYPSLESNKTIFLMALIEGKKHDHDKVKIGRENHRIKSIFRKPEIRNIIEEALYNEKRAK